MPESTPYQSIVLMGKIASGKGTQAHAILSHFGGVLYSTGNNVRAAASTDSVFGTHMKRVYEAGLLIPEWIASYWMTHALVTEHLNDTIIFEGVAKKPDEAVLFDEIHTWLGRPYIVFNLDITDDLVHERSAERSRDIVDGHPIVETRLEEYALYTQKSIEFFRSTGNLVDIDGSIGVANVTALIFEHLRKLS